MATIQRSIPMEEGKVANCSVRPFCSWPLPCTVRHRMDDLVSNSRSSKRLNNCAVFFDRDGTLMEETQYCADPAKVWVYTGIPEVLGDLKKAGFLNIVITNQSGLARGLITLEQYHAVQNEFLRQIGVGLIDKTYFCADPPDAASERRKPAPGMVLQAAQDLAIDLEHSYFVGDKSIDVECGQRAGTRTVLVLTGYGAEQEKSCRPDFIVTNAVEAARLILRHNQDSPNVRSVSDGQSATPLIQQT